MSLQISLAGRIALVTGASRGIGRAIAIALARAGADVAVNYRRDDVAAGETVAAIEALGRRASGRRVRVRPRLRSPRVRRTRGPVPSPAAPS